jgi:hypothetical protein
MPPEQKSTQFRFERLDVAAQGGLCDAHSFRRRAQRMVLRNCDEHAQVRVVTRSRGHVARIEAGR